MDNSQVAKVYAKALLEIASEKNILDDVQNELASLTETLTSDKGVWEFLSSPIFRIEDREKVIEKAVKGNVSELLYNFLGILMNHDRFAVLGEVLQEFIAGVDSIKGRIRAKLISGQELSEKNIKAIQTILGEKFKSECVLESEVNGNLIGGFMIRFNDMLIDRSIASELLEVKQHLLQVNLPIEAISK